MTSDAACDRADLPLDPGMICAGCGREASEHHGPQPAAEITAAIQRGDAIVCYAKCWPCQFGQCQPELHTWMDDDDIEHAGVTRPTTPEGWAALAAEKPCGCRCMGGRR